MCAASPSVNDPMNPPRPGALTCTKSHRFGDGYADGGGGMLAK
jgi:hypothetical protein